VTRLLVLGVSHKTAPVEVRERLALPQARASELARELREEAGVPEVVTVSTCNRTEVYAVAEDPVAAESAVLSLLARRAGIGPTELAGAIYAHHNCDAARHLYRVVSGLDSMIVGEDQIQGQVKRAYESALAERATGPLTNHLFEAALSTGKRVRAETAIGERRLSAPTVAVALAAEQLGSLAGRQVVLIGTGETSELTARALSGTGAELVFVASRRRARALSLAAHYGGASLSFDELPEALLSADIVVAATASPHLLIEVDEIAEVMRERGGRPLLLIDLAVPRDVQGACARVPGVTLRDIDDLEAVVARNRQVRQAEARRAETIIEQEIQEFASWLGSLEVLPTIAALRSSAARIAEQVLAENAGRWESASPRDRERIEQLARTIVNRLLHEPTLRLKDLSDERLHVRMAVIRDLFGLSVEDGELEAAPAAAAPAAGGRPAAAPALASDAAPLAEVRPLRRPA
jgi:glutamyl-tRNA reductase